ncbi:MAG: VTT domain-containing protein [Ketobacteraceae bacterium]|nr:VTT domain-containing protein [Ketobacteraceae bacterium]
MQEHSKRPLTKWLWLPLLAIVLAFTLYHLVMLDKGDIQVPEFIQFLVEPETHPGWYFGLLATLPMLGFPISVFCLLAGMKFGVLGGTVAIGLAMAIHLIIAYWLGQSFLKEPLHRWLARRGYHISDVPEHHQLKFAISFVVIPVIPYAVKNYLLALSHLRLRYYLGVAWIIQMLYSIPLIAITGAVQENNPLVFAIALAGLAAVFWISRKARQRAMDTPER